MRRPIDCGLGSMLTSLPKTPRVFLACCYLIDENDNETVEAVCHSAGSGINYFHTMFDSTALRRNVQ